MYTDPIADLLTRLRNASKARHQKTTVPASRTKKEILRVMKEQKFIKDFQETTIDQHKNMIEIELFPEKAISLKRISKPGQRIYKKTTEIFPILRGFGFAILSTPEGIMTGEAARQKGIGGEVICELY